MALRIEDVSPTVDRTQITEPPDGQSVSGRALTIAASSDGKRVYLGNNAAVWRSKDGGVNWEHMTRPQPTSGTAVPGALLALNVYDLVVSAKNPDLVLASTGNDIRNPDQNGLYRSTDGGENWQLVRRSPFASQIAAAPDDSTVLFVAGGDALAKSADSGATWSNLSLPLASTDRVWNVAVGPGPDTSRRIYALGTKLWFSTDGGTTWKVDTAAPNQGSPPADDSGTSARMLAIHPSTPTTLYTTTLPSNQGIVWKGDYSLANPTWQTLAPVPISSDTTASGTDYIHAHVADGKLYLFVSDRSHAYVSVGDSPANWVQIDKGIHVDPHGLAVSPDFRLATAGGARGKIWQVNDGGVYLSTDGAKTWKGGRGFSSLSLINVAVNAAKGRRPAICFGTGDNGGFFSPDGGRNWISAQYQQGDNDACFSDPRQPSLLYVFAPRGGQNSLIKLYVGTAANPPNAGHGTTQEHSIPGPAIIPPDKLAWNCVSSATEIGYRPLILTGPSEAPKSGGDFICVRVATDGARVLRTTNLAAVTAVTDWDSTATAEASGVKVFRQGPLLPNTDITILQASGGHATPTFYVGDTKGLWKWTDPLSAWQALVPVTGGPKAAVRFYADPYRTERIYLVDTDHVWRSTDGGGTWAIDSNLQAALTESAAFPLVLPPRPPNPTPFESILQDLIFDPVHFTNLIAVGPAGVFSTPDGTNWDNVVGFSAAHTRTMSTYLDTVGDAPDRTLYVATPFRGLIKLKSASATGVFGATGISTTKAQAFAVFRPSAYTDPFVASADPDHPDTTRPEGKLQKALTDAITAKASEPDHHHVLKPRDPKATDFLDAFPMPITIADVTGARPYPVAHYNPDEVDFIASEAKIAVLYAAMELRTMVRRFAADQGITQAPVLLEALKLLDPQILNAVQLIKDAKDVRGRSVRIDDKRRLPNYQQIFDINDSGPSLKINFKGAVAAETDATKKKKDYDFGHSLWDMIVNSGDDAAQNCIDFIGYGFLNGALEAGGFFERPTPANPLSFQGIWVGGNYAVETIRGEMSVNDGPAQFGGTTRQLAKMMALIRAGTFADPDDPNGDLTRTLLNNAQNGAFPPALEIAFAGNFKYELNKLGWAYLGNSPRNNWVASEIALIQTVKLDGSIGNSYVVAWQNMELTATSPTTVSIPTRGGHLLYGQGSMAEIITNTVAAYE